ncbi:uncharacterized protein LOC108949472 [Ciona intestinalis]
MPSLFACLWNSADRRFKLLQRVSLPGTEGCSATGPNDSTDIHSITGHTKGRRTYTTKQTFIRRPESTGKHDSSFKLGKKGSCTKEPRQYFASLPNKTTGDNTDVGRTQVRSHGDIGYS